MEKPGVSRIAELINRCAGVFGGFIVGVICTFAFVVVFGRVDLSGIGNPATPPANLPARLPEGSYNADALAQVVRFDDLEGKPAAGPKKAPVTIVEFSDFHCPFCKRVQPALERLKGAYPGKIRHVWRHFPLPFHQGADRTHMASQCAQDQGKFWEYHSAVFAAASAPADDQALIDLAAQTGLDRKAFEGCLSSNKHAALIQQEVSAGQKAGANGTPTFFINGKRLVGSQPYESFDSAVVQALGEGAR